MLIENLPTSVIFVSPAMARFLIEHGQEFQVRHAWPEGLPLRRGKLGNCYQDASSAAVPGGRWIYCEGVATEPSSRVLMPHGWVYDRETHIAYDPTWRKGTTYFGVPVLLNFIYREQWKSGFYELVNDANHTPAIFTAPPNMWRDSRVPLDNQDTISRRLILTLLDERVHRLDAATTSPSQISG